MGSRRKPLDIRRVIPKGGYGLTYVFGSRNANILVTGSGEGSVFHYGTGRGSAIREGSGKGHAHRRLSGHGSAIRRGSGDGDALRTGKGNGGALRDGDGSGNAVRTGKGHGDAIAATWGNGMALRGGRGCGHALRCAGPGVAVRSGSGAGNAMREDNGLTAAYMTGEGNGEVIDGAKEWHYVDDEYGLSRPQAGVGVEDTNAGDRPAKNITFSTPNPAKGGMGDSWVWQMAQKIGKGGEKTEQEHSHPWNEAATQDQGEANSDAVLDTNTDAPMFLPHDNVVPQPGVIVIRKGIGNGAVIIPLNERGEAVYAAIDTDKELWVLGDGNVTITAHSAKAPLNVTRELRSDESGTTILHSDRDGDLRVKGFGHGDAIRRGDSDGNCRREGCGDGSAYDYVTGVGMAYRYGYGSGDAIRNGPADGYAIRSGNGHGDAKRTGDGHGHAIRKGNGNGDALRYGPGDGYASRGGNGNGNAQRSGSGEGGARRIGHGNGREVLGDDAEGGRQMSGDANPRKKGGINIRERQAKARLNRGKVRRIAPTWPVLNTNKLGRNCLCVCGSGKKFKRCCLAKQQESGSNYRYDKPKGWDDGKRK